MAIKTFTTGEVLTAADTNTYLANSGLVYVTSATVGSGVSSVTISNCFSSTFDQYRIIYTNGACSTTAYLGLRLGAVTTGYYGSLFGAAYAGGAFIGLGLSNAASWSYAGFAATYAILDVDVINPNLSKQSMIDSRWVFNSGGSGYSMFVGEEAGTTQHTAFTITPSSGTLTGGNITVYGYRRG